MHFQARNASKTFMQHDAFPSGLQCTLENTFLRALPRFIDVLARSSFSVFCVFGNECNERSEDYILLVPSLNMTMGKTMNRRVHDSRINSQVRRLEKRDFHGISRSKHAIFAVFLCAKTFRCTSRQWLSYMRAKFQPEATSLLFSLLLIVVCCSAGLNFLSSATRHDYG